MMKLPLLLSAVFFLIAPLGMAAPKKVEQQDLIGIEITKDVNVAYHIKVADATEEGISKGVKELLHLVDLYEKHGVPEDARDIHVIFDGPAAVFVLNDAGRERLKLPVPNPNAKIIADLVDQGVSVEVCGQRLKRLGATTEDLLPGVKPLLSGQMRVIDLQLRDYAYFRF